MRSARLVGRIAVSGIIARIVGVVVIRGGFPAVDGPMAIDEEDNGGR